MALGLIGAAAAAVLLVDPLSPIAIVRFLALIAFHVAVGWRLYSQSRVPVEAPAWPAAVTGRSAG